MATTYAIPPTNPYVRQCALQRQRHGRGELPRDLRLWLPQSVALELRSRQRPALAERRRAGRARGSGSRDPRRQLRLALFRRHESLQRHLRPQPRKFDSAGRAVRTIAGILDHRRRRVSRQRNSRVASGVMCSVTSAAAISGASRATRAPTLDLTQAMALETNLNIASFGEDTNGEVYIVHLGGTLHRLVQGAGGGGRQIPTQLSQTGCVNATTPTQPASGLIPYAPNAPFYSDGAVKDALARAARRPAHRREHGKRFRIPERQRADEELQHWHHARGDAALHAPQRRQLGRLHV